MDRKAKGVKGYRTIEGCGNGTYEDRKSRFLSYVAHVETEDEALAYLDAIRREHPMARHHVYAYALRANSRVRYSDDGEPRKTAGLPTLSVIEHLELADVICVTVRYFGGTLLGTGGLVRAYTKAPQNAFEQTKIVTLALCRDILVGIDYGGYDQLAHLLEKQEVTVVDTSYADNVTVTLRVPSEQTDELCALLTDFTKGKAELVVDEERMQFVE